MTTSPWPYISTELAIVLDPLIIAPLSEVYGRIWLLCIAHVIFLGSIVCASSHNLELFIASGFRASMGFAGIVFDSSFCLVQQWSLISENDGMSIALAIIYIGISLDIQRYLGARVLIRSFIVLLVALYTTVSLFSVCHSRLPNFQACSGNSRSCVPNKHEFSAGASGVAYLYLTMEFLADYFTLNRLSDEYARSMEGRYDTYKPEYRLPSLVVGAGIIPGGLFWYHGMDGAHTSLNHAHYSE
ncbi:caffeine resistance 5 protein [Rutstroemia sp. NJR-2017a BVV2]|nr:caffeine resistance 5 protein [Rutstroemia sp. NJR-2017a BVV2]